MTRPHASLRKWIKKIDVTRSAADDERIKIGHAVALLLMLGEHIGRPGLCPEDVECQDLGLRVAYLAQQIVRHAEDLDNDLQEIESAVMALERGDPPEPERGIEADSGNVVHLNQPDGDAA